MCLFSKGRCAVIAALDLALHQESGPVALPAICQRTGLSLSYLEGIFRTLRHAGIMETVRGSHGGFMLARPVESLTVADIVLTVDDALHVPPCRTTDCVRSPDESCASDSAAYELWASLDKQLVDYLATITLKDLLQRRAD